MTNSHRRRLLLGLVLLSLVALSSIRKVDCSSDREKEEVSDDYDDDTNSKKLDDDRNELAAVKQFNLDLHSDDHSIYSNRQLMSLEKVKNPIEELRRQREDSYSSHEADTDDYEALETDDFAEREWNLMFRAFDTMSDSMTSSLLQQIGKRTNIFEEVVNRLQPKCRRDINHIRNSIRKHKLWALKMVDSNGKIPSGLTYGKFSSPGDYEECLGIKVDELVYKVNEKRSAERKSDSAQRYKFRGKYCLIDFRLPLPERPPNKLLSIHDPIVDLSKTDIAQSFPDIKNYSGYASVFYEIGYLHAFCLPSSCDVNDLVRSMSQALEGLHILVNSTIDCEVRSFNDETQPLTKAQKISIGLMSLLFLNAFVASLIYHLNFRLKSGSQSTGAQSKQHGGSRSNDDKGTKRGTRLGVMLDSLLSNKYYAECFSVQKNFERLTKPDPRGLVFVHYTRIVAMALTVITHTAGMGTLQAITKPADASNSDQIFRDFIPQMLANAFGSIQIFYFMAGFMLVISTYPAIKRENGYASFLEYATKRAIRLLPGLAATIAINFLWPLFVDGPMLSYFIRVIVEPCETSWWRTLSFMSNFDHVEKMCLRHSYFSASDYQLHIMGFPVLVLLYKRPAASLAIAFILTVLGFVAQTIMVLTKTLVPFMMVDYIDKQAFFNVVHYIHHPVWNHMSAFFYGFIMGYLVVKQKRIDLSPMKIRLIWSILMPLGMASIFAPYFWNHYKRPIYKWQIVTYIFVDRLILLTTCAWISYGTMVLGRPPPKRGEKDKPIEPETSNLPNTVTLIESDKKTIGPEISLTLHGSTAEPNNRLDPMFGTRMPRQRSSPNILGSLAEEMATGKQSNIRSASSSLEIASSQSKVNVSPNNGPAEKGPKVSKAPVSNINTLCLMLSRLTFQLYLFNMVVLWIDVNHSKYQWYISYYFIITKALAVYIASTLMAIVFFVLLESPCLTLYIMWVKKRAEARAKRRLADDQSRIEAQVPSSSSASESPEFTTKSKTNSDVGSLRQEPVSKRISDASGIQINVGLDKPSFSFIDMSKPETVGGRNSTS